MNCLACQELIINHQEVLNCSSCKDSYHYTCLGMTKTYFKKNKHDLDRGWQCTSCNNVTKRYRNDDTPVRKQFDTTPTSILEETNMSIDFHEPQQNSPTRRNESYPIQKQNQPLTIEQIGSLLDSKLTSNNNTIFNNIKHLIQSEINTALEKLKNEFIEKNNTVTLQQQALKTQLEATNLLIKDLQNENEMIKRELSYLKSQYSTIQVTNTDVSRTERQFILYGLDEQYGETETDLYPRIDRMFNDLQNISINGFIESARRVGKGKGGRRPVILELISKRMRNFVLQNAYCFHNTGYAVSEVLDQSQLGNRKHLRECLINARKQGKHAVIRYNKLFINGKEHTLATQPQQESQPNSTYISSSPEEATCAQEHVLNPSTSSQTFFRK
jgi:hypothetical protein